MSLRVLVDGAAMAEEPARAFWSRFSAWMEEHRGDLGGFARTEGLASVQPEMHGGEPVLVASRTAQQGAYTPAPSGRKPTGRPMAPRETPRKRRR
jgi:hypothetical protein